MKTLEDSQTKIQKMCDLLKQKTLQPAKLEAEEILEEAKRRAAQIVADAEKQGKDLLNHARSTIEKERSIFHSSLEQAAKLSVEALRQHVETKLFNDELHSILQAQMAKPQVVADLIRAIVEGLHQKGLDTDLMALIPKKVSMNDVNKLLGDEILKKLKSHSVALGAFDGGAQVRLHGKKVALDITENTLKELLANYVRKDFRKLIFGC